MKTTKASFMKYLHKFSLKWHFLTPDTHSYVCVSGGTRCYFYGELSVRIKWMTLGESYIHCGSDHWACWINLWNKCSHRFKNPLEVDTLAYCISDQNNFHKHPHYCQDILSRNFLFQHNLHLKTQVFDFHIIHFLKSRAPQRGHGLDWTPAF